MKPQLIRDQDGNLVTIRPPVIPTVYKSTANLKAADYPMNLASKSAAAKTRSPAVSTSKPVKANEGILSQDKYVPGDLISSDQYVEEIPGRLEKGYGCEALHNCYHGGTIFQDAASNLVRVQNQVSLGAGETVMGKAATILIMVSILLSFFGLIAPINNRLSCSQVWEQNIRIPGLSVRYRQSATGLEP